MNKKAEKLNDFLVKNNLSAKGHVVPNDPLETVYVTLGSVHGLEYHIQFDSSPIVGIKGILARNVDPNFEGLLALLNKLSAKYKTHSYLVDGEGFLCVSFMSLFTDETFDSDLFVDFCTLVDQAVADDLPEIFELLGLEIPEGFSPKVEEPEIKAETDASEALGE